MRFVALTTLLESRPIRARLAEKRAAKRAWRKASRSAAIRLPKATDGNAPQPQSRRLSSKQMTSRVREFSDCRVVISGGAAKSRTVSSEIDERHAITDHV